MDSIVKRVLGDDWSSIQSDIEKMAADKVKSKIDDMKTVVLAKMNDIGIDKIREILAVKNDTTETVVTPVETTEKTAVTA